MSKVSQKDIAISLNVSRVTVTKALKDHPDIAEHTRKMVKEKALEMGYFPDFIGRSLSSKKTGTIGVVIPKIAHSFFANTIEQFYERAKELGYHIIPMVSFEDSENEYESIRTLLSMRVDGLIIDVAENSTTSENYDMAKKAGTKVLFFDRCLKDCTDGLIATNDSEAACEMTTRLIAKGYKRVYHFSGPGQINIASARRQGYEKAVEHLQKGKVVEVHMTVQGGYDAFMALHKAGDQPDAIFAVNDSVAHGIYKAAEELGISIPNQLAVAGFGDIESSRLLTPPLTSVRVPVREMAREAISIMVDMIDNDTVFGERRIFKADIVERGST